MIAWIADSVSPRCDKVGTILDDGNVKCFFPPISLPDKAGNENLMGLPKEDHLTLGRWKFPVPVQIWRWVEYSPNKYAGECIFANFLWKKKLLLLEKIGHIKIHESGHNFYVKL